MNARIFAIMLTGLSAGCTTDEPLRYHGVSHGAGDAIAANTVMQMVDPWPAGVEQTDLKIPADHEQYRKKSAAAGEAGGEDISISD